LRATEETIQHVMRVCGRLGVGATLNLAVTEMAFARYSTDGQGNSLYFVEGGRTFPDAIAVASERVDGDRGWREVPDRHLLTVREG
jgi:glutamine amidotransferase